MKKIFVYVAVLGLVALLFSSNLASAQGTTYNPTVFTPNGTRYDLNVDVQALADNGSTLFLNYTILAMGNLTLYSERMDQEYIRWGGSAAIQAYLYQYMYEEEPKVDEFNKSVPIPPVVAVQQNTRKVYAFNISLDQFEDMSQEEIMNILQSLTSGDLRRDIYFLNPFYIPTDVDIGYAVTLGYWNTTADDGFIIEMEINKEGAITLMGTSYDAWIIEYTGSLWDALTTLNSTFNLGIELPSGNESEPIIQMLNETQYALRIYYDKASGWLLDVNLQVNGEGNIEVPEENQTMTMHYLIDAVIDFGLGDAGSVSVGGQGFIARHLGISDNMSVLLGLGLLVLVFGLTAKTTFRKH
ncbi:MAG: hypothetical protein ACP6IU_00790 [Candidatus Asgardarchaeia archaeon]